MFPMLYPESTDFVLISIVTSNYNNKIPLISAVIYFMNLLPKIDTI